MANTKHGSRRRPPRRIREHRRRAESRHAPLYGVGAVLFPADAWNTHPRRDKLGEPECPPDHCALVAETVRGDGQPDDGVLLVAHFPIGVTMPEAFEPALSTLAAMMDRKFGRAGW